MTDDWDERPRASVREDLRRILRDGTLITVAFAIALGFALQDLARAVGTFVTQLAEELPSYSDDGSGISGDFGVSFGSLSWRIGDHVVVFGPLVAAFLELWVVVTFAVLVYRWRARDSMSPTAADDEDSSKPI